MILRTITRHSNRNCHLKLQQCLKAFSTKNPNPHFHPMVYSTKFSPLTWPENHTFKMSKFADTAKTVVNNLPTNPSIESAFTKPREQIEFNYKGKKGSTTNVSDPPTIPQSWFSHPTGPHSASYFSKFINGSEGLSYDEQRIIGFRNNTINDVIERTIVEAAGTIKAAELALQYGLSSSIGGGTHHAFISHGSGFTILNDMAIASMFLLKNYPDLVKKVLVIDLDVHQGDGTASFSSSSDHFLYNKLVTLSVHAQDNYPFVKASSNYDLGLASGTEDEEYLRLVTTFVKKALNEVRPDFVLYIAGVDIHSNDKLGKLNVSTEGMRRRDWFVLRRCALELKIPTACVVGGGYSKDRLELAARHSIVHEEAAKCWREGKMYLHPPKYSADVVFKKA